MYVLGLQCAARAPYRAHCTGPQIGSGKQPQEAPDLREEPVGSGKQPQGEREPPAEEKPPSGDLERGNHRARTWKPPGTDDAPDSPEAGVDVRSKVYLSATRSAVGKPEFLAALRSSSAAVSPVGRLTRDGPAHACVAREIGRRRPRRPHLHLAAEFSARRRWRPVREELRATRGIEALSRSRRLRDLPRGSAGFGADQGKASGPFRERRREAPVVRRGGSVRPQCPPQCPQ